MFYLILFIFIIGYLAIALEHPLKIDKAATALFIGVLTWTIYIFGATNILSLGYSPTWETMIQKGNEIKELIKPAISENEWLNSFWNEIYQKSGDAKHFVLGELEIHLIEIAGILFFLIGAMTIVEIIDQHDGFGIITKKISTTHKVKLLWVIGVLTFFMSAVLDNLTTTIVMVTLLRKLIYGQKLRWLYASVVIIAANSGGAWSPIGDVTTIMLWIGGQITTIPVITKLFVPSMISLIIPLLILSFTLKGFVRRPETPKNEKSVITNAEQKIVLFTGVSVLLFVPIFKTLTKLPPFMGMLFGLGILWILTEILHCSKKSESANKLRVFNILRKIDTSTVLFFLGILMAVSALQSAGHLNILANWLNKNLGNVYLINSSIGFISAVVDNVPLVAGAMGMYEIALPGSTGFQAMFVQDGTFWELLAYCAGTGGSMLIIGSAAGVAAMGIEKIDFIWYLKNISLIAVSGYFAGLATYYTMFN